MANSTILILALSLIVLIILIGQYFLYNSRKKDRLSIDSDWSNFLHASSSNHIGDIKQYGDKLVWNKHLKQDQLTEITKVVNSKIDKYPELEKLSLNVLNKQARYDRIFWY